MTKNNWFITNLCDRKKDETVPFDFSITPYQFYDYGFQENCKRTAIELYETNDRLYLSYSGGCDSHFVLKTFLDLKLEIIPVIVSTDFNVEESSNAIQYCTERQIKFEILNYSKDEFVERMKKKIMERNFFSLMGGVPLLICDEVNRVGGKLLTGYGDPFSIIPGVVPTHRISKKLEFSEWDYYLDDYDPTHPSGFFTYDLSVFYSLISQIDYTIPIYDAKCNLYGITKRNKVFYNQDFYLKFREIKNPNIENYSKFTILSDIVSELDKYRILK